MFLIYDSEEDPKVKGYTNTRFQNDRNDSCSQLGFMFLLNRGVVSLKSSKQATIDVSTMETGYITTTKG